MDHTHQDDSLSAQFQDMSSSWLAMGKDRDADAPGDYLDCRPTTDDSTGDGNQAASKPALRNLIGHETVHGYRTFELWQGDITRPTFPVDVLVVSSIAGMITRSDSVVGALKRIGIDVVELGRRPDYDLRELLGVWLSHDLGEEVPFRRILCLEFTFDQQRRGNFLDLAEILDDVFAALALFDVKGIVRPRSVALPLLGAGGMVLDPELVIGALIPAAKRSVERSETLERVAFFAYGRETADLLDEAMNATLGRTRVTLSNKKPIIASLCDGIAADLDASRKLVGEKHRRLLHELQSVLRRDTAVRSFEVGILGRRFAEMLVSDLLGGKGGRVLARNIDALKDRGVATWIMSYLHVLRHLGNESAHETDGQHEQLPAFVGESDLVVGLVCMQRLLEFWIEVKETKSFPQAIISPKDTSSKKAESNSSV